MEEHTRRCEGSGNIWREVRLVNWPLKRDTWEKRLSHKDIQVKYSSVVSLPISQEIFIAKFFTIKANTVFCGNVGIRRKME